MKNQELTGTHSPGGCTVVGTAGLGPGEATQG